MCVLTLAFSAQTTYNNRNNAFQWHLAWYPQRV
jgi:hypothetical protein